MTLHLTASSYALYGERLGLLEESPKPESQEFINAVETMLQTTLPLLFIPPGVMRWVNNRLWQDHLKAWDIIFSHGQPRRSRALESWGLKVTTTGWQRPGG